MIKSFRPGWLTIGPDLSNSNYDWGLHQVKHQNLINLKGLHSILSSHILLTPTFCQGYFSSGLTTGCTERIEQLRPKSPPPKAGGRGGR